MQQSHPLPRYHNVMRLTPLMPLASIKGNQPLEGSAAAVGVRRPTPEPLRVPVLMAAIGSRSKSYQCSPV